MKQPFSKLFQFSPFKPFQKKRASDISRNVILIIKSVTIRGERQNTFITTGLITVLDQ